jgi:uncharacterized protein YbjT (DUF2867 family)
MAALKVFVCGATGTQGGSTARHLISHNATVRAIARDINSSAAKSLQSVGVQLLPGDFDNEDSLREGISGCTGVFLNLSPNYSDTTLEITRAKRIISIAKESGVTHFIYSSSFATEEPDKRISIWNLDSRLNMVLGTKQSIEQEVRTAGFEAWTVLRPANFMSNFLAPLVSIYPGRVQTGVFTNAFTAETLVPLVDPDAIGKFAAAAFVDTSKFNGKHIDVVSEMTGVEKIVASLAKATGREFSAVYVSPTEIDFNIPSNVAFAGQVALRDMSKFVDMDNIRAYGVPLGSFEEFLRRESESVQKTYSQSS